MVWDPTQSPRRKKPVRRRRWQKKRPNYAAVLGGGGGSGTNVARLAAARKKKRAGRRPRRPWRRAATLLASFLAYPGWMEPPRGIGSTEAARGTTWTAPTMSILVKRAGETRTYWMDFGNQPEIQGGQTLSSPSVTATPAGLTITGATISGNRVQATIAGGTDGILYTLSFQCATSGGATLVGIGYLQVDDQ